MDCHKRFVLFRYQHNIFSLLSFYYNKSYKRDNTISCNYHMASKSNIELIKKIYEVIVKSNGFDAVMKNIQITGGGNGRLVAEFKVIPEYLNRGGGLHGGFTATLVDNFTTYALLTKEGSPPGVSVDLHVSYLKGAKEGDEVIIDAQAVRAGRNLAYLECELRNKKDGSIIAKGSQTKYVGGGGGIEQKNKS